MFVAYEPDDYLHSLIEIRKSDARRLFRKSIYSDYPLRGPLGQAACAYCGQWHGQMTIDHVIPKSKSGPHFARWNLVPACQRCNLQKTNLPVSGGDSSSSGRRSEKKFSPHGCLSIPSLTLTPGKRSTGSSWRTSVLYSRPFIKKTERKGHVVALFHWKISNIWNCSLLSLLVKRRAYSPFIHSNRRLCRSH